MEVCHVGMLEYEEEELSDNIDQTEEEWKGLSDSFVKEKEVMMVTLEDKSLQDQHMWSAVTDT